MAASSNSSGHSSRRTLLLSSSLDQQNQLQQQPSQSQQQQQQSLRRGSAVPFSSFNRPVESLAAHLSNQQRPEKREAELLSVEPESPSQAGNSFQGYHHLAYSQTDQVTSGGELADSNADRYTASTGSSSCGGPPGRFSSSTGSQQNHNNNANLTKSNQQTMQATSHGNSAAGADQQVGGPNKPPYIKDEVDIVFNRLMALEAFRKLHPTVIRNLCSYAFVERIEKGVIGDDAINWYALLEGSVDVKASQSGQKDDVTLCTLGEGTTFGASVMPGKSHSVSVVTSDDCTLLRVRRADFQEIFSEQSHLISNVESSPFCPFTSLSRLNQLSAPGVSGSLSGKLAGQNGVAPAALSQQELTLTGPPGDQKQQAEEQLADELNLESLEPSELSSQLMRIGWVLRVIMLEQKPELIRDRRVQLGGGRRHSRGHANHAAGRATSESGQSGQAGQATDQQQQPPRRPHKQLVSVASRSQLLASGGRRVANYVASSFMGRSSGAKQAAPVVLTSAPGPSHALYSSNSFELQQASAKPQPEPISLGRCMVGREMTDWLLELSRSRTNLVSSRLQAVSMWQVLLEQGVVYACSLDQPAGEPRPGSQQFQFCDDHQAYYKFCLELQPAGGTADEAGKRVGKETPSAADLALAHESLWWSLKVLSKLAPDAGFRLILAKRPQERSAEEVDIVYEELQHLKALGHLTNSVKKELAGCVTSEHHWRQNAVLFNQGDPGDSWYIILRGSVNVVIVGKGVVCTLHEGDDFGKLALVNDAPRAATIVTNEPNCYFLRVDKLNFNTILRDVEANTVRLKEHGKEVLILQRVPVKEAASSAADQPQQQQQQPQSQSGSSEQLSSSGLAGSTAGSQLQQLQQHQQQQQQLQAGEPALKYMVVAGTGEKMLEHLLETRIDGKTPVGPLLATRSSLIQHDQVAGHIHFQGDNFLEDFILTHKIFMATDSLCQELLKQYGAKVAGQPQAEQLDDEYLVAKKRRVVKFVRCWMLISREQFFHQPQIQSFLTSIHRRVKQDAARFGSLQPEFKAIARILELHLEEQLESKHKGVQRWIDDVYGNILPLRRHSGAWDLGSLSEEQFLASLQQRRIEHKLSTIQPEDEVILRVYCADHSYAILRVRIDEEASHVKLLAAKRLKLQDKELILVHVKSNGERIIYNDLEFNISTSLSVNGRLFVCPLDHIDAISPLPEQDPFQEVYQSLSGANCASSNDNPQANSAQLAASTFNLPPSGGPDNKVQPNGQSPYNTTTFSSSNYDNPISSHLLLATPTNNADIKTQMSLSVGKLEEFSSRDVAYCLTQLAWSLLRNMHESELIYTVFGCHNFHKQITANLNVFLRHFNEIQYWVVTQICLSTSASKRVQILRKFIKIASHCKELQNLNAFFAIIMGLSNMAVARLTQTWERLPSKLKRTFSQFESLIDPSRNHRRYRIFISKMEPPIIPFMPLFLKDMTFALEGNKTYLENGLINFEKMQMVAQTLRTIRYCKSRPMKLDSSACKFKGSIRSIELFFRDLKIIDNQRTLTQMSHQLEHRKT